MIKNIILDVGKVLVEWDCDLAFRRLGFDEDTLRAVAAATVESSDWDEYDRSTLTDEELLESFLGKAPAYEREIRLFWDNVGLPVKQYDYSRPWIRAMKAAGYHVYILSNYARRTYAHSREALSFLEDVDGAVFSFQTHSVKPEPEIYEELLTRYGLDAASCIFLDDRQVNLDGAARFGIRGIHFTTYEAAVEQLKEYGVCF
ncbi:MAG: HAD family hydrolase [Roseburia sp.]